MDAASLSARRTAGLKIVTVDGDELMPVGEFDHFYGVDVDERSAVKRDALADASFYWPDGVIPFQIDASLANVKADIYKAVIEWETWTCLRFVEVDTASPKYRCDCEYRCDREYR